MENQIEDKEKGTGLGFVVMTVGIIITILVLAKIFVLK